MEAFLLKMELNSNIKIKYKLFLISISYQINSLFTLNQGVMTQTKHLFLKENLEDILYKPILKGKHRNHQQKAHRNLL